ncbi:hypothetical protein CF8_0052 [Aeromonas phage CF8]|nr:hypothetical protein CF8_0052 [Aeromonas phage CF8]
MINTNDTPESQSGHQLGESTFGQANPQPTPDAPFNSQTTENNTSSQQKETVTMSNSVNALTALLGLHNITASQHQIPEIDAVIKDLDERVKNLRMNTAAEAQKATLPKAVQTLSTEISPQLPGIAVYTVIGKSVYVMPVLFFKNGITDATDTVQLQNEAPRGFAKVPNSFMTKEILGRVKQAFAYVDSVKMEEVFILSQTVVNLERYIKNDITGDDLIRTVVNRLMDEWGIGLLSLGTMLAVKANMTLPSPFKNGKLFGEHDAAIARIEAMSKFVQNGSPTPYNLSVKLATTNRNQNGYNQNQNNSKSVITTNLNVQLEMMSPQQFQQHRMARTGAVGVGPLVPVVSIGNSIPGETLNHNSSPIAAILGLYAALSANGQATLAEAYRGKEVGNRGNLSVFNHSLAAMMPGAYGADKFLTDKNIMNIAVVSSWIQTYVSTNPVYVMDVAANLENSSTSEFWFGVASKDSTSPYYRAVVAAMNVLSNGKFSELANQNASEAGRDKTKQWVLGDPIVHQTRVLRPRGIAQAKDGKWFDLGEIDAMFLRQPEYYGQNEQAIAEFMGLIQGSMGGDVRVRQFNIISRLQALTNNTAQVEGWDLRLIVGNSFANTMAQAMVAAGTISVSASNYNGQWTHQVDNEVLNMLMTATLAPQNQNASLGLSSMFLGGM